jgi:hypothetical protein
MEKLTALTSELLTEQQKNKVMQSTSELHNLKRLKEASDAAKRVCKGCVDFGKTDEKTYQASLALVTEYLAGLAPEMLRRVTSLAEGILLKSKFMPTVADYHALVKELEAKDNQFKPAPTSYHRFKTTVTDDKPYHPEIVPYISNRPTRNPEHYAAAQRSEIETREGIRKAERMLDYVKYLGNGVALDGWLVAIELGQESPPDDWALAND